MTKEVEVPIELFQKDKAGSVIIITKKTIIRDLPNRVKGQNTSHQLVKKSLAHWT